MDDTHTHTEPVIKPWCIRTPSPSQLKWHQRDWFSTEGRGFQKLVDWISSSVTVTVELYVTMALLMWRNIATYSVGVLTTRVQVCAYRCPE